MGKYLAYFNLKLHEMAAYRGQLLLWVMANVISLIVIISLVGAAENSSAGGMNKSELIVYYLGGILLLWVTNWYPFGAVARDIKDGAIVGKVLLKPVSYFWSRFFAEIAWHTVGLFFGCLAVMIVAVPLLSQIQLTITLEIIIQTLIAICFSIILIFTLSMLMGLMAFWFTHVSVLDSLFWTFRMILAGQLVPLSFLPPALQSILILLPFRYMVSFPLDVFLGQLTRQEILTGYFIASIWSVILLLLYSLTWNKGVKAYTAFGS